MLRSLPLLKKAITLDEALSEDDDILQELSYPEKRLDFFYYLFQHRTEIEAIVSFHLGISKDVCKAGEVKEWVHGSFNACVPIYIDDSPKIPKKVFIRFPLPYKVGESHYRGNAEEKLRCEVATYIWMQSNCPDIPIPYLRGFGFPGGQTDATLSSLVQNYILTQPHLVHRSCKCASPCQHRIVLSTESVMVIWILGSMSIRWSPIAPYIRGWISDCGLCGGGQDAI